MVKDLEFPAIDRLLKCCSKEQLSLVADRKGSQELNVIGLKNTCFINIA